MTRTVFLLRHAKSSWAEQLPDAERPLAPRGERAAAAIAGYLRDRGIRPALVLCSPARRTRQTLAAIESSLDCPVEIRDELYGAWESQLLECLRALPDSVGSVLLIGHNPGIEELALSLASHGARLDELAAKFPTGALATLELDRHRWADVRPGDAELVAYVVPRELG